MGSDPAETVPVPNSSSCVKAHNSIYLELTKILEKITGVLPAIEAARPGCTAGIRELCNLNNSIEKAKLLIQHCAESSKLYLAITGESVVLRCERIRTSLDHSLFHVQNMVPQILAVKISGIQKFLKGARFIIESSDDEAGKAMLELLRLSDSSEELEFKAFQIAVSSLKITSPKALLIERRSIKKLLDKINGSDPKKEKILNYLLYLIKKYGKKVKAETYEHKVDHSVQDKFLSSNQDPAPNELADICDPRTDSIASEFPVPEEFCCPISSRLMYDPVIIASGQTFERAYIEKWFNEGHDTCPKTQKKLMNVYMIPNSCMKDLIFNWCKRHNINLEDPSVPIQSWENSHCSSISSLRHVDAALLNGRSGDYLLQSDNSSVSFISSDASFCSDSSHVKGVQLFSWSDDYSKCQSFSNFSYDMYTRFFHGLCELPLDLREKEVCNLKILFENNEEMCYAMLSNGFAEAVVTFLKYAYELCDMHVQRTGAQIFLAFLSCKRVEIPSLSEDMILVLSSLLDSEITLEALTLFQKLSQNPNPNSIIAMSSLPPSIIKFVDCENHDFLELSVKILLNLSSHRELKPHIVSSGCIPKLAPFLSDGKLTGFCLKILNNLCDIKEALALIAETNGCIASIAEILEMGNRDEKDHGVSILHSLCSQSLEHCLLVMKEGVIPSLVDISVNGNLKGREKSLELLHLLKDLRLSGSFENSDLQSDSAAEIETEKLSDEPIRKQPSTKSSGFVRRKFRFLFKPR